MENSFFTNRILFSSIPSVFFDITNVILGILSILVSAVLFTTSYKKIRCKFPVTVNCWFCNNFTKVPYNLSNSWDCPHCKQYNGFNKDGGYNKIIHEQYDNKLNEDVVKILKKSSNNKQEYNLQNNGLCKLCNINQELKVQQLALFVPLDENNYFEEIELYREKLEKAYRLCSACEKILKETLKKQEYNLLKNRLNSHKLNFSKSLKNPTVYKYWLHTFLGRVRRIRVRGLRWLCILFSILLFFASIFQYDIEHQLFHSELHDYVSFEPFQPVMEVVLAHLTNIYKLRKEISLFGFICFLLSHSLRQGKIIKIKVLVWLLLHILFWINLTGFQILLCGLAVFLNVHGIRNKNIYLSKNSLKLNYGFQPEKRIFPEIYDLPEKNSLSLNENTSTPPMKEFASSVDRSDIFESRKLQEIKTIPSNSGESRLRNGKKEKNKENEIEFILDKNEEETQSKPDNSPKSLKMNSLNSSVFSKPFLSTLENQDKTKEETMEPLDEVHNNLGCLNLGRKHKKSTKPSNYLFASHNFSEKISLTSSSVIKPAKFIRNLSNSWTGTESNESASRSSTPSSGYSSQKIDKTESNRYDFPKTMPPLSVNPYSRLSPRDCFDYYDGNGSFYNNFNCFPQGFVPFQQYPSPLGHTTVYTYSRPTNIPFSFPPQPPQAFPSSYKYSPSSTRFSDASDCDNLFHNASKTYENNKKWCRLKSLAYNLSIFLNLMTLLGFVSFFCAGIISVDWQLPKLNFFM